MNIDIATTWQANPEWIVEHLRWTIFPQEPLDLNNTNVNTWWSDVTQKEADSTSQTKIHGIPQHQALGDIDEDTRLSLLVRPFDYTWQFMPNTKLSATIAVPVVGFAPMIMPILSECLRKSIHDTSPKASRLALGGAFFLKTDNREVAYEQLNELLKPWVKLDASRSSDFSYIINRKRQSTVIPTLSLNRLAEWGAVTTNVQWKSLPASTSFEVNSYFVRVGIDINTDPTAGTQLFEPPQQLEILFELLELGKEIIARGDIE